VRAVFRPSELARQRASVRALNERLDAERLDSAADAVSVRCECGGGDCTTVVDLHYDAYLGIRRHPGWFVVAVGHEAPEIGRIEQRRGAFSIVESTYVG
jgi:hypothetical protein